MRHGYLPPDANPEFLGHGNLLLLLLLLLSFELPQNLWAVIGIVFLYHSAIILHGYVRDDTHMTSMKIVQFCKIPHPPCSSTSKIVLPPWPWTSPNNNCTVHVNERNQNKNKTKHVTDQALYCSIYPTNVSLKDGCTLWRQSQKEDFLSIIY